MNATTQNELDVMTYFPRDPNGSRILIVEDNADLRRVLTEILQFEGFEVFSASSGESALQLLETSPTVPQLIMTDILMDGMDGCAFLSAVRADTRWRTVPVIFLSGQKALRDVCGETGLTPDGYVEKPFGIAELVQTIRKTIGGRAAGVAH